MERNKKNTVIKVAEPTIVERGSDDAVDKGAVTSIETGAPKRKIPVEINGPKGPEPTRYGDWEQKGRCTDF